MNERPINEILNRLNIEELNSEEEYSIHFSYKGEFNLSVKDLKDLLYSLNNIYKRNFGKDDIQIKSINSGSLDLFLQVFNDSFDTAQAVFATSEGLMFVEFLKNAFELWKIGQPSEEELAENNIDATDAKDAVNVINNVSDKGENKMEVNIYQGDVYNIISLDGNEAAQVKNRAKNSAKELKEPSLVHENSLRFKFYRINDKIRSGLSDRIMIDPEIHKKAVKVKYDDVDTKEEILQLEENLFDYEFVADAGIEYKQGEVNKVIIYDITDVDYLPDH